jgi:hypothetical protein
MTDFVNELTCIEQIEAIDDDFFFIGDQGSEKFILKNGVIRKKAYTHILRSKSFAEEYLNLIRTDQIDFDWQTQNLTILDRLDDLIKGERWDFRDLTSLFSEAMLALAKNASRKLSEIQSRDEIEEAVQMGYQFYGFNGLTGSAVAHARRAAVQGMIRKFAEQYGAEGGYKGDLYGNYRLELTKPRVEGVIPWLARSYLEGDRLATKIDRHNDGTWSLQFFGLIPFNDINRLGLAIETCRAAIPVLECALEMDATVFWKLSD